MFNYYLIPFLVLWSAAGVIKSAISLAQVQEAKPDLSRLTPAERESIEMACLQKKILEGPAAYHRCLRIQLDRLAGSPQRPDLSHLSRQERESIEMVCLQAKVLEGPAAYNSCLQAQLSALSTAPRAPDLSRLTSEERRSIETACLQAKVLQGPAAYNKCLQHQFTAFGQLSQNIPSSRRLDSQSPRTPTGSTGAKPKPKHHGTERTHASDEPSPSSRAPSQRPQLHLTDQVGSTADENQHAPQKTSPMPLKQVGSGCDETFIGDVRHDGAIVETGDGRLFEIDEIDQIDSSLWLVADDLLVCWETYIHKGTRVTLYTLRNGADKVSANRIR